MIDITVNIKDNVMELAAMVCRDYSLAARADTLICYMRKVTYFNSCLSLE